MSDIKPAQVQNWNLSIQRQFGTDWLVSATYIGDHIIHMLGLEQLNPAIYFPGNDDARDNCFAQGYTVRATEGAVCTTTGNTNQRRRWSLTYFQTNVQILAHVVTVG